MSRVTITDGPDVGNSFDLRDGEKIVGRAPGSDILLPQFGVSRRHARFSVNKGLVQVEDLGSSNGTYVNGMRLAAPHSLKHGDEVRMGAYTLLYQSDDATTSDPVILARTVARTSNLDLFRDSAGRKLQAVLQTMQHLARALDLDSLQARLFDQLFVLFPHADRAVFILMEKDLPVVKASRTAERVQSVPLAISRAVLGQVLADGVGVVAEDTSSDSRFGGGTLINLGVRSFLCTPLMAHGEKPIGAIQLDRLRSGHPFTPEDLSLLTALALEVSVVLENARLHAELVEQERIRRDLALAREIQQGFLPQGPPAMPGERFELHACIHPAQEMAGDFYDYFPLDQRRLLFAVGDVAGKGMPAALFMAMVRTLLRHLAQTVSEPGELLQRLNNAVSQDNPKMMFVTVALGILDVNSGEVVLASGGHPETLYYSPHRPAAALRIPGPLLGYDLLEKPFATHRLQLQAGDCLCLYTDGVTEAPAFGHPRDMFGVERLCEVLAARAAGPLEACAGALVEKVIGYTAPQPVPDDITLLFIRWR